ncbi:MAG: hypothetical protein IRY89_11925, partial [Pseudolabrys sp.]|nr:hypothetical protein [Pseudolabrys sp.]
MPQPRRVGIAARHFRRHCEEPRKRRRSNPVLVVPQAQRIQQWHCRFWIASPSLTLGLAMTGENALGLAMTAENARGRAMTGNATRHCEEPRKRRRSNPVLVVPQAQRIQQWHRRFWIASPSLTLGLAMTG